MIGLSLFYLSIEANRYCAFAYTRDRLWANQTPLSDNFNRFDWFMFFMERMLRDNSSFQHIIEHIFWNVPYRQIDKRSLKRGLFTIASGGELHDQFEQKEYYRSVVERVVDVVYDEVVHDEVVDDSATAVLLPFVRINNTTTNHAPASPLFRILPIQLGWSVFRTFGQYYWLSSYTTHRLEHGLVMYRRHVSERNFKPGPGRAPTRNKLLFIHGVGIGVFSYMSFIDRICSMNDVEIVLLELPGVSGTEVESYPTAQQLVDTVVGQFEDDDIVDGIGHSYGSLVLSYITNQRPNFLRKRIFIDTPVFFPDSTKFWPVVFRPITWSHLYAGLASPFRSGRPMRAMSDFIFSEQWTQHLIHNATYFYEYCNREIGLDHNTLILLGGRDHFVSPYEIERYMRRYHPSVVVRVVDRFRHGDVIGDVGETDYVSRFINSAE